MISRSAFVPRQALSGVAVSHSAVTLRLVIFADVHQQRTHCDVVPGHGHRLLIGQGFSIRLTHNDHTRSRIHHVGISF